MTGEQDEGSGRADAGTAAGPPGYVDPRYALALAEFGTPLKLPESGAWALRRSIAPGDAEDAEDAMSCYPMLACRDWAALAEDLAALDGELVSFTAVTDPFGTFTEQGLARAFPDLQLLFKHHFAMDLGRRHEINTYWHRRQRKNAVKLGVRVEFHPEPAAAIDQWMALFEHTVRRFALSGIRAFSRVALARHLALPGAEVAFAYHRDKPVAGHIYLVQGDVAYAHLGASGPEARGLSADHAIYAAAIDFFAGRTRWINWGGEVGTAQDPSSSLVWFKRRWSTDRRPVYLCGRVMDRARYDRLTAATGAGAEGYFPAYRAGEFG